MLKSMFSNLNKIGSHVYSLVLYIISEDAHINMYCKVNINFILGRITAIHNFIRFSGRYRLFSTKYLNYLLGKGDGVG